MASLSDLKGALTFLLAIAFALILSYLSAGVRDRPLVVNLEGRVYEKCIAGVPMGPVGGATISTSIDAVTATTDKNGRFQLMTSTPNFTDERHFLTARHGDLSLKTVAFRGKDKIDLAFSCIDSWRCALPGNEHVC